MKELLLIIVDLNNRQVQQLMHWKILLKLAIEATQDYEFLVSKETVVLRRWERSKQKFGFIKRVDKG